MEVNMLRYKTLIFIVLLLLLKSNYLYGQNFGFEILTPNWRQLDIIVPEPPKGQIGGQIKLGAYNQRDMWYSIKIYKWGAGWEDITPENISQQIIGPKRGKIFQVNGGVNDKFKIELSFDSDNEILAAMFCFDFMMRGITGVCVMDDSKEEFIAEIVDLFVNNIFNTSYSPISILYADSYLDFIVKLLDIAKDSAFKTAIKNILIRSGLSATASTFISASSMGTVGFLINMPSWWPLWKNTRSSETIFEDIEYLITNAPEPGECGIADELVRWHPNGTLIQNSNGEMYRVVNSKLQPVSMSALLSHRFKLNQIIRVTENEINAYKQCGMAEPLNVLSDDNILFISQTDKRVWLYDAQKNKKRHVISHGVMLSLGYDWKDLHRVDDNSIYYQAATNPIPFTYRNGSLIKGSATTVYIIEDGLKCPILNESVYEALGYCWENIIETSDYEINLLETGSMITEEMITNPELISWQCRADDIIPIPYLTQPIGTYWGSTPLIVQFGAFDNEQLDRATIYYTEDNFLNSIPLSNFEITPLDQKQVQLNEIQELMNIEKNLKANGNHFSDEYVWNLPDIISNEVALKIVVWDHSGNRGEAYTQPFSISRDGYPPIIPNLYDPGIYSTTGNFTIRWNDVATATSYKLWEDDNSNFTSPREITCTESQYSASGYANGWYYYKAKSINQSGESESWSNVVDIEVRVNQAPYAASNPSPQNNATGVPLRPNFSWDGGDPDGDAVIYRVLIGTTESYQGEVTGDLTQTNWAMDYNLIPNKLYYWKIWARDLNGLVTESPVWKFTTVYLFPDLTITTAFVDDNTPEVGQNLQLDYDVKNVGNKDVTKQELVAKYYISNTQGMCENEIRWEVIPGNIPVGQEKHVQTTIQVPNTVMGQAYLDVFVNYENNPSEDVRTNNISSIPLVTQDTQAPQLTLYYPPQLPFYKTLNECSIVWDVQDNSGIDHFDFYYSLDNGATWNTIIEGYVTNTNGYEWMIPDGAVTNIARVKMVATDTQSHSATAISNAFEIVDGRGTKVTVTSPNGGESWDLGSTHEITWEATSPNEIISFQLVRIINGDNVYIDYAQPGNARSYTWTLPSAGATDKVLIKIKTHDEFGTESEDISDNFFSITDPFGPPDPPWHVPEAVTQLPNLSYPYLGQSHSLPAMAIDGNGDVHIAYNWGENDWRDGLGVTNYYENQIYYRRQLNGTWQPPIQVTDYPLFSSSGTLEGYYSTKKICMEIDGNGIVHLIWIRWAPYIEWPNYDDDVFYSYFNGTSWSDPENISAEVTNDPQSRIDVTDIVVNSQNNIHVVWTDNIYQGTRNTYQKIRVNGYWQSAQVIEPYLWYFFDLAADNQGNVHMITAEMADIFHKVYDGNSWSSVSLHSDASKEYQDCRLKKGEGNTLHAAVRCHYYDSNRKLWIATIDYFYYDGTSWSSPEAITSFTEFTNNKRIGLAISPSNYPTFVWVDVDKSVNPHIYTMYSRDKTSAGLSPIKRLSDRITYIDYSKASIVAACNMLEKIHVIWKGRPEGEEEIIYNWASTAQDVVPPTVTVTSPTADHVSSIAAQETISWIADDDNGIISLNINFSEDGGQTFSTVATGEQNDGEYLWNVPVVLTDSAIVSVTAFDIQGNEGIGYSPRFRISDTTPPEVSVQKPNGGENLQGGITTVIEWSANDNFYIKSISLEYSLDGGAIFQLISDNEINDGQANWLVPTTASDNAFVRVIVSDSLNNTSIDVSDSKFSIMTSNNPPYQPYAPIPENTAISVSLEPNLSWKGGDPDKNQTVYDVYFGINSTPTTKVSDDQTTTSYITQKLNANTKYYWQVVASDGIATTSSPVWNFETGDVTVSAPSNLTKTASASTSIGLSWTDNSDNESLFIIEGKTDGDYSTKGTVTTNNISVTISNLAANTQYTFRTYATNGQTNSGYSNEVLAITTNRPPNVPSNPSPQTTASGKPIDITLSWTGGDADIGDVVKYDVYFGTNTVPDKVATVEGSTTYSANNLNYNTFYFWRIVSEDLLSAQTSGPLWSFSTVGEPLPAAPANLAIQEPNSAQIQINWTDASDNEVGFKLGRRLKGQEIFTQIAVTQADQTEYFDENGLLGDSTYVYGVRAYNTSGNTIYSNEDQVVAPRTSYYDFPISEGAWYMSSLPITPFDNLVANIFPNAVGGSAFTWNGTNYTSIQNVSAESGYWLPISDSWFGDVSGYGVYEYSIHFGQQGWYMIGGVVESVDFTNPNDSPDGSILTPAIGYDPYTKSYYPTDVIEAKQSYWIAVLQPCDLNIGGDPIGMTLLKPYEQKMAEEEFYSSHGAAPPSPPNLNWETGELIVVELPTEFKLYQNYPNPFNPVTNIKFDLPENSLVEIVIYNILGQKVKTLVNNYLQAGNHTIVWNGMNEYSRVLSSGVFLCFIKAGEFRAVNKLLFLK